MSREGARGYPGETPGVPAAAPYFIDIFLIFAEKMIEKLRAT
jgi:hypothetical protein